MGMGFLSRIALRASEGGYHTLSVKVQLGSQLRVVIIKLSRELRPNQRVQLTPLRGRKIVRFLKADFV